MRVRAWSKDEAKEKAKIARITDEAGGRVNAEDSERARAWAEVEAKEKVEIARVTAQDSERGKAAA